jgi:hypothetical protein
VTRIPRTLVIGTYHTRCSPAHPSLRAATACAFRPRRLVKLRLATPQIARTENRSRPSSCASGHRTQLAGRLPNQSLTRGSQRTEVRNRSSVLSSALPLLSRAAKHGRRNFPVGLSALAGSGFQPGVRTGTLPAPRSRARLVLWSCGPGDRAVKPGRPYPPRESSPALTFGGGRARLGATPDPTNDPGPPRGVGEKFVRGGPRG